MLHGFGKGWGWGWGRGLFREGAATKIHYKFHEEETKSKRAIGVHFGAANSIFNNVRSEITYSDDVFIFPSIKLVAVKVAETLKR